MTTDWPSLVVAFTSLVISLLTFYRVELRGPVISVITPLEEQQRAGNLVGRWNGGLPQVRIDCRLLIANEGPRAGLLESFTLERPGFVPNEPRILTASASLLLDERGHAIGLPAIIRDGEIVAGTVRLMLSVTRTREGSLAEVAHDLRETEAIRLRYSYKTWRRSLTGRLKVTSRTGHVDLGLSEVRDQARGIWAGDPGYQEALALLNRVT